MKTVSTKTIHGAFTARGRQVSRGFALIVTMILMVLIILLCIGLLGLATTSQQTNTQGRARIVAQANAKLALMVAVGQIQKDLGGDQFATAQATILASGTYGTDPIAPPTPANPAAEYAAVKNPHWVAAFPTYDPDVATATERPFYIRRPSDTTSGADLFLYDSRYCNQDMTAKRSDWRWTRYGSGASQVQWLVSNPNPAVKLRADRMTPGPLLGTSADFTPAITATGAFKGPLLYPSTSSKVFPTPPAAPNSAPVLATIEARAPIVPVKNSAGSYTGAFAYLVSDDSLKYKIAVRNSVHQTTANAPKKTDGASFAQLLSPQNTHLEGLILNGSADTKLQKLETTATSTPAKTVTLATLPLQSGDATFASKPDTEFSPFYQHSFTSHGHGLLTDPISGGLKRNLTAYLERPSKGSRKDQKIDPIKPTDSNELGSTANGIVQDSISDTSSLIFSLKDKDPVSGALTPGSMTTQTDPEKRLTWFAPVFGLLRDYVQLRNPPSGSNTNLGITDPIADPKAPAQARGLFWNSFGAVVNGGFGPVYKSTDEPSAMTSWDVTSDAYTADSYLPGTGADKQLAPSLGMHPILVKATAYMYPACNQTDKKFAYLLYPRVVLYNPYNVKLAGKKYVVSIKRNTGTYARGYRFQGWPVPNPQTSPATPSAIDCNFDISNGGDIQGTLAGNNNDLVFLLDNTAEGMMPGESLLFCPAPAMGSDVMGGGKYARLYKASEGNIDKMVLTANSKPADGTAFYRNGPDNKNPADGSELWVKNPAMTVNYVSSGAGSINTVPLRMIKLYLPSPGANLAAPLSSSLANYSLLQAVEAVSRYERLTWSLATGTPKPSDSVPFFTTGTCSLADPKQFDVKWLNYTWVGMRIAQDLETQGDSCPSGSCAYPLFAGHDIRASYVGHTWDVTNPQGDGAEPPRAKMGDDYYARESNHWIVARDGEGTNANVTDPLNVLGPNEPLNQAGRSGLNVMSPFMRTGTLSANAANAPMFDAPRNSVPVLSIADLRNARLNSFFGAPSYIIGNSYGTRLSPRSGSTASWTHLNQAYVLNSGWQQKRTYFTWLNYSPPQPGVAVPTDIVTYYEKLHYQIYDQCYEANHSLWDRFFLTGVEGDPTAGASSPAAQSLPSSPGDPSRLDVSKKLPNPRLVANPFKSAPPLKSEVTSYFKASENLLVDGAFNVNCTDPLAWQAMLASFRKIDLPLTAGGTLDTGDRSPFSRILTPPLNRNGEPTGLSGSGSIWQQVRCLTDAQIETLSNLIVEQVKRRAPFVSVSDFVNRRLIAGDLASGIFGPTPETDTSKWGLKGPLQAAIDDSGINGFLPPSTTSDPWYTLPAVPGTRETYNPTSGKDNPASSKYADALGYLTQGDILAKIGSVLTVRGDTFTIRAYGDARDVSGKVIASTRCEATIQRIPDYVDATKDPLPQASFANLKSDTNRRFGRQFKIIAFRWLLPTE